MTDSTPDQLPPIVDSDWLREHRDQVVVVDARAYLDDRNGIDAYRDGHIDGARFLDLDTALAGPAAAVVGRHPLPTPEDFADALGTEGIDEHTAVVAYDDVGGMIAGRLVWMLRILEQPAALLDGGILAWPEPLVPGAADAATAAACAVRPWPPVALADADQVAAHIEAGGIVVDSRSRDRYRGEIEPIDPRAGHVPGAINLPFADNLVDGRFRSGDELAERFAVAAVDDQAIVYCGSGVSACHNILAAERAGFGRPRLYVGSWSGWSSETNRPIETSETDG